MIPNTTVTLYATPFDITNRYVVYANSEADAFAIVSGYPSREFTNCYWQRNYRAFRAKGNINELSQFNYCVFENDGKKNFAFITSMEYHNDDYTDIELKLDFWLNYAGQYSFLPSPMRRCHPLTDEWGENINGEPFSVGSFVPSGYWSTGEPLGYVTPSIFVITTVNALTFETTPTNYWDAYARMFTGEGNQFAALFSELKSTSFTCAGVVQGNTSFCDEENLDRLLNSFERVGRLDCVVGAYRIPFEAISPAISVGYDLASATEKGELFTITRTSEQETHWKKIEYSPQFNHITVNCGGNVKEYDILQTSKQEPAIEFVYKCNQTRHGCVVISSLDYKMIGQSVLCSPEWDEVQIVGYGSQTGNLANRTVSSALSITKQIIGGLTNPLSISGRITDAIGTLTESQNQTISDIQGQGYLIGSNSSNLTTYCLNAPLIEGAWYIPNNSELKQLDTMFCTYGYSYNGEVENVLLNHMPIWNYVETQSLSVIARRVPQWAITECIQRFNSGIFIFKDKMMYKQFGLAPQNHL